MPLFDFFGFKLKNKVDEEQQTRLISVVPPSNDDAAEVVGPSSSFGSLYYNLNFNAANEAQLINKYRELSQYATIDEAISEIINEMIFTGDQETPVDINLDKVPFSDDIKKIIRDEFEYLLKLLDFNENSYDIIRQWYVDGKLYYNVVIDPENVRDGIIELRQMDPRKVKKIREITQEKYRKGARIPVLFSDYYLYEDVGLTFKIPEDTISGCHSGLIEDRSGTLRILSFLDAAIKPFNQLRMVEDSLVIYRMARAPERRIFKIDVGNMPPQKAEQYVNQMALKHKKSFSYDSATGDLKDETRNLALLEDYFFAVREGGRGTDISTLPGGANLGEIEDVRYMQKKLYRALRVPVSRLDETSTFNTGRSVEIIREENKFSKFIHRLRVRFSTLFTDILKKQLILKNIVSLEDWNEHIKNNIFYDFKHDSYFSEYNEADIQSRRMELAAQAEGLKEYYSKEYIQKKFLRLTEDEIEEIELDKVDKPKEKGGVEGTEMDLPPEEPEIFTPTPMVSTPPKPTESEPPPEEPAAPEGGRTPGPAGGTQ